MGDQGIVSAKVSSLAVSEEGGAHGDARGAQTKPPVSCFPSLRQEGSLTSCLGRRAAAVQAAARVRDPAQTALRPTTVLK